MFTSRRNAFSGRANTALVSFLLCLGAPTLKAQDAQEPTPPPSNDQLANAKCISGMEKFLPGEYFYCLATQSYGENKHRYADKFFKEAASWASKPAQYVLGVMALNGDQQPVNRPLALAWFALASERHTPRFQAPYDELKAQLSPAELAKADDYLASMKKTYGDAVAAPRAEERYRDGTRRLIGAAASGTYCMEGLRDPSKLAGSGSMDADTVSAMTSACVPSPVVVKYVDSKAGEVFEDWSGHVTVGAIDTASPPADAAGPRPSGQP
jgi:hypothetical protein